MLPYRSPSNTAGFTGHLSFEEKLAAIGPHDLFAEKAVELDPNLAETQTALAIVRFWNQRDWSGGEDCFKQAIKLNPNYVTLTSITLCSWRAGSGSTKR